MPTSPARGTPSSTTSDAPISPTPYAHGAPVPDESTPDTTSGSVPPSSGESARSTRSGRAPPAPPPAAASITRISPAQLLMAKVVQGHGAPSRPAQLPAASLPFLEPSAAGRPLLLLDLDHTLIHTMGGTPPVGVPGVDHLQISSAVHVCPRPHLKHFLDEVSKRWDVSIFTASTSETARPKIDWLVKYLGRAYFQRRFYREACTTLSHHGLPLLFVKDLRTPLRSDADLARTVLVEDLPAVCGWQSSNVVPIDAWWGDPSDDALPRLLPLLAHLAPCDDVRRPLRRLFGFERGAKAHEGAGCPAYGTPTASPRAEWSAGPPGCTCASLYEHRLSAGFPLEWSACPPSQVATRHKPPPTTTPQKKRSDPAESPARALQTLEDSNGTPGKRARR